MKNLLYAGLLLALWACGSPGSNEAQAPPPSNATDTVQSAAPNTLTEAEKAEGWMLLFDGTHTDAWRGYLSDSFPERGWKVEEGVLKVLPVAPGEMAGSDIITRQSFGNFELKLEFAVTDTANSGIFYLVQEREGEPIWHNAPEYQILDNQTYIAIYGSDEMRTHLTCDNYDLQAAPADYSKPVGQWNVARIVHHNGHVEHWLNGQLCVEYQIGSPEWEELVAHSKFRDYPNYGRAKEGPIGLQDHGHEVWFRNIKIRRLD